MRSRARLRDPVLLAIVVVAAALRIPGLFTDFWLDEIWTLKIVYDLDSAVDVFTEVRHSNNHHLNTLIYYLWGDRDQWALYRLHSLVAGVASVALAWAFGARRGRSEAVWAAGLCTVSYLLVHFSSEARGYAMVIFFAIASLLVVDESAANPDEAPSWAKSALFWVLACLGFLSHLMYLHAFLACAGLAALAWIRASGTAATLARGLRLFGPPAACLAAFYWLDIRNTKIGQGPEYELGAVLVRALSYALGGPPAGGLAAATATGAVLLWSASIGWMARKGRSEWVFFAIVIFASPVLVFAVMRPEVMFVRYLLFSAAFGTLALAAPLAAWWEGAGARRALALAFCALFLLGNGRLLARFYEYGRGSYLEAMRFIVDSTPDAVPMVAGDHRFRTHNVIRFYNRYLPLDDRLVYLPQKQYPDWLLLHRIGDLGHVDEALADEHGHAYNLAKVLPYSDLSGWHWLVYRKVERGR